MGRSIMSLSRNHHLMKSLFFKRTFHNNTLLTSYSEREKESFLVKRYCSESDASYFSLLSIENWAPLREFRLTFFERWGWVSGSCNGILHLYDGDRNDLLWMPSANQFKVLPPSKVPHVKFWVPVEPYGFGFDAQSQDYKVVKFSHDHHYITQIELYSLKNDSWKEILEVGKEWDGCFTQVYVNGRYYWQKHWAQHEKNIISFDFTSEKFSHVVLPPKIGKWELLGDGYFSKLVEFDGKLGIMLYQCSGDPKRFELWVLQNDGSWTSQFEISIGDVMKPVLLSSDGRFLFLLGFDDELIVYDFRIGELKKLGGIYGSEVEVLPFRPTSIHPMNM